MANNRLFLCYRPTGDAVFLGKRMAEGWYGVPDNLNERVEALFQAVINSGKDQDDFALCMEQSAYHPRFLQKWRYEYPPGGNVLLRRLVIDSAEPYGTPEDI